MEVSDTDAEGKLVHHYGSLVLLVLPLGIPVYLCIVEPSISHFLVDIGNPEHSECISIGPYVRCRSFGVFTVACMRDTVVSSL